MSSELITLSTPLLELAFSRKADRLILLGWNGAGNSLFHPAIPGNLFAVYIGDQPYDVSNMTFEGLESTPDGQHTILNFRSVELSVKNHIILYEGTGLLEMWQEVTNVTENPVLITRLDSFALNLDGGTKELSHFTSDWGQEFELVTSPLRPTTLETRAGRSSKGQHPWFALDSGQEVLSASVAWSGNWVFRFELHGSDAELGYRLSGGLHDWEFFKELAPRTSVQSPRVILAVGRDLNAVSQQYAHVGRRHWYPRNTLSASLPAEWNHWWSYEDKHINEQIFLQNVKEAARLGMDVCTLDAGWFGPSETGTHWYDYRGDWDLVNIQRFPSGIRALADQTHAEGLKFGLWCEIEGLGSRAKLAQTHPGFVARRAGDALGYVCLGNPQARAWAYDTLCRLIGDFACDWIKLDFNLDPGAGCDCTDHGHNAGDGLFEHYVGYYSLLERVRERFPDVVLESCSSGGLRIDLGLLRRTDMTFLSDPDWPVHDLQIFWGASTMLAADTCLHWSFCEWVGDNPPPQQSFNPRDPTLAPHQLDYFTRISMLGVYGLSQRLPDLPVWVAERLEHHAHIYKNEVRSFISRADLYRLTEQPRRNGEGERWSAFQYSLPNRSEHLLFVFRLPGGEAKRNFSLCDVAPVGSYQIEDLGTNNRWTVSGQELFDQGLLIADLPEEGSHLLKLTHRPGEAGRGD